MLKKSLLLIGVLSCSIGFANTLSTELQCPSMAKMQAVLKNAINYHLTPGLSGACGPGGYQFFFYKLNGLTGFVPGNDSPAYCFRNNNVKQFVASLDIAVTQVRKQGSSSCLYTYDASESYRSQVYNGVKQGITKT